MPGGISGYLKFTEQTAFGVVSSTTSNVIATRSGGFVISAGWSDVIVWNVTSESEHCRFALNDSDLDPFAKQRPFVTALLLSNDETIVIAGYSDGRIRLWDMAEQKCLCILHGHKGPVLCLALQSESDIGSHHRTNVTEQYTHFDDGDDDLVLISGGNDTDIIVWDWVSRRGLLRMKGHHQPVTAVRVIRHFSNLKSQSQQTTDDVTGASDHTTIADVIDSDRTTADDNIALGRRRSQRYVLSGSRDCSLKLWDITEVSQSSGVTGTEGGHCIQTAVGHKNAVSAMDWDPSSNLVVSGGSHMEMIVWLLCENEERNGELKLRRIGNLGCGAYLAGDLQGLASSEDKNHQQWVSQKARISQLTLDGNSGLLFVLCNDSSNLGLFRMRSVSGIKRKMKNRLSKLQRKQSSKESTTMMTMKKDTDETTQDDSEQPLSVQIAVSDVFCELTPIRTESRLHSMALVSNALSMVGCASHNRRRKQLMKSISSKTSSKSDAEETKDDTHSSEMDVDVVDGDNNDDESGHPSSAMSDSMNPLDRLYGSMTQKLNCDDLESCEKIIERTIVRSLALVTKSNTIGLSHVCVPNWSVMSNQRRLDIAQSSSESGGSTKVKSASLIRESLVNDSTLIRDFVSFYDYREFGHELGHANAVRGLDMTDDCSMIASVSRNELKIWNTRLGRCIRSFRESLNGFFPLNVLFIGPNNRYVMVGTKEGFILVFDSIANELSSSLKAHDGPVYSIALSWHSVGGNGGKISMDNEDESKDDPSLLSDQTAMEKRRKEPPVCVISGGGDSCVKLWEFELVLKESEEKGNKDGSGGRDHYRLSLGLTRSVKFQDQVLCVKVSQNGRWLAVSLLDSTIQVLLYQSLKFHLTLFGHKLPCFSIDISDDCTMLVSGSMDKNIKLWGLRYGDCLKSMFAHRDSVMKVEFIGGGKRFISASKSGAIGYWCGDKYKKIQEMRMSHVGEVWALSTGIIRSNGKIPLFVSAGSDRSLRVFVENQDYSAIIPAGELDQNELDHLIDEEVVKDSSQLRRLQKPTAIKGSGLLVDFTEKALRESVLVQSVSTIDRSERIIAMLESNDDNEMKNEERVKLVLKCLMDVPNHELYEILLVLPWPCVQNLMSRYLAKTVTGEYVSIMNNERVHRIFTMVLRLHYKMFLSMRSLGKTTRDEETVRALGSILNYLRGWLKDYRRIISFNNECVVFMLDHLLKESSEVTFTRKIRDQSLVKVTERKGLAQATHVTH